MTEERAINYLRQINPKHIECVELIDMKEVWENIPKAVSVAEKALREIQQYRAIGTVEECREAREKQRGRKVNNRKLLRDFNKTPYSVRGDCPNCGSVGLLSMNTDYCDTCGQKLDWTDAP